MKFTNGYWVTKPGVQIADASQIRQVRVEDNRVYLYAVPYHKDERGMGGSYWKCTFPLPRRIFFAPRPGILWAAPKNCPGLN